MNWLFEQLRPKIDETALYDDMNVDDGAPAPRPAPWRLVVLGGVLLLLGMLLLTGVVLIGIRVDWVLTTGIPWRRTEIWAGAAMAFLCLLGVFLSYTGLVFLRAARRSEQGPASRMRRTDQGRA